MYKLKTKSAAKKRFTKVGGKKVKIKRAKAYRRHYMTHKSAKKVRQSRNAAYVCAADFKNILALLPY